MTADHNRAMEFAQILTTSGHPELNETVNLAAAFLEVCAELERERKAHKQTSRQANEAIETTNQRAADLQARLTDAELTFERIWVICDCDEQSELCPRGVKRALQTCGFSRCFVPAPDAIYTADPIVAHSKSQYRRLSTQGANVVPPADPELRNYPEDYKLENGNYWNTCGGCQKQFLGHKQRRLCKQCLSLDADPALPGLELTERIYLDVDGAEGPSFLSAIRAEIAKRSK